VVFFIVWLPAVILTFDPYLTVDFGHTWSFCCFSLRIFSRSHLMVLAMDFPVI